MTQSEINRAVAQVTGETVREIRRRGFSLVHPIEDGFDDELDWRPPLVVDWDQLEAQRHLRIPSDWNYALLA